MKFYLFVLMVLLNFNVSAKEKTIPQIFNMIINEEGYVPSSLKVKSATPITLKITRKTDATCAREIVIPSLKMKVDLPLNKEVAVNIGPLAKGDIKFGCAMDLMISGVLIAE